MTPKLEIAFLDIGTREELADFLGIELKTLTMYAYSGKNFYRSFDIGKKSVGASRKIHAPAPQLKRLQRRIAEELDSIYMPPSCVHGFRTGRSVVSNAQHHVGSPAILCLDLKDFFPSISAKRVQGLFKAQPLCFPTEVASALTELCCHKGSLPQGAPTSPVISNMICMRLDKQLSTLARTHGVFYTRYADDITFSAKSRRAMDKLVDSSRSELLSEELLGVIRRNGFDVNNAKTHVARKTERQTVTGVIVNRKCNYPREEYRTLRVVFHNWESRGIEYASRQYVMHDESYKERLCLDGEEAPSEEAFKSHIRGRLEYYSMIDSMNESRSTSLERLWTMYHDRTGEPISYVIPSRSVFSIRTYYDYAEFPGRERDKSVESEGSCFATTDGKLITCKHCIADAATPFELTSDCECDIHDPRSGKKLSSIPINLFERDDNHDFAVCMLPEELKGILALPVDTVNRPVVGQRVRAFGVLYEHGGEAREIDCRIDLAHADGAQYRVAAPFIKGMSGGPVLNRQGHVIGIVTQGSAPENYTHDGYFLWIGAVLKNGRTSL